MDQQLRRRGRRVLWNEFRFCDHSVLEFRHGDVPAKPDTDRQL